MWLRYFTICLLALLAGLYLQLSGFKALSLPSEQPDIPGFLWPSQKAIQAFSMLDTHGGFFDADDLAGKWSFVFFGYTHCPDICPITLHTMHRIRSRILEDKQYQSDGPRFVFVSVDGERDTPEHLDAYLDHFGEHFIGATGNRRQVDSLTTQLGVPYEIAEHEPGSRDYLVAHSGAVFLISPQGRLAGIFQPPHAVENIAARFAAIEAFMARQG